MSSRHRIIVWSIPALLCAAGLAQAQDWPQWRGPQRDAKAAFQPPAAWPETLTQKWKIPVGEGVATPALVGDKLYVFARQNGQEILRCLNAETGDELWKDGYASDGAPGPAASFSGPRCSPAVGEGMVVTIGVRGKFSCLDAAKGTVIWRKDDFSGAMPRFATSSSPIIIDGLVVAQLGGGDNGVLAAYDLKSGDQKWKWTGESPAYASPALMTVDGAKLIIAETEKRLVAVQLADGKQVWEMPFVVQGMRGYNACTPVIDGQTLIISGSGRGTKAVKFQKDGDAITAKDLWSNPDQSVQFNTPVVKDGKVYGLSQNDQFFCLDEQDGKTVWTAPVAPNSGAGNPAGPGGPTAPANPPAPGRSQSAIDLGPQSSIPVSAQPQPGPGDRQRGPGGREGNRGGPGGPGRGMGGRGGGRGGYGSIVDAGDVLFALTPAAQLIVYSPKEKEYKEQARIKVADSPTYAYPVLSGKRVFIKDQDSVMLLIVK